MNPVVFLIVGGLLIWAGLTGRVESLWNALRRPPGK